MNSDNRYSASPDLVRELDLMIKRLENRLHRSDVPPAGSDFFRYRGAVEMVDLVKNLCFGVNRSHLLHDAENSILRHDTLEDEPSNELAEEEE